MTQREAVVDAITRVWVTRIDGGPCGICSALWQNPDELKKYDMILNSCLCAEQRPYKGTGYDAVTKWVNSGGRMFGSHFSFDWLRFRRNVPGMLSSLPRPAEGRSSKTSAARVRIDIGFV